MTKPLIDVALGRQSDRKPIWFLRQAGRYLPEYMAIRKKVAFTELCRSPELAAEVTLQPLRRFDLDASIIFSDILIPCTVMGQNLSFGKGHGPILEPAVRTAGDIARLRRPQVNDELGYVGEAIKLVKKQLKPHQTMIGFAGAPFTVASYMIEGSGSKTFSEVKSLRFNEPDAFVELMSFISEVTVDYLAMQVEAGAECLMLFDTWAGQMSHADYRNLVFPHVSDIIQRVKRHHNVPIIYYPGQSTDLYAELHGIQADVVAIDWRARLDRAIQTLEDVGLNVSVQGNLDPHTLASSEEVVRQCVREVLAAGANARGHIFNVGHGLLPHVNPEALNWVIDEVRATQ